MNSNFGPGIYCPPNILTMPNLCTTWLQFVESGQVELLYFHVMDPGTAEGSKFGGGASNYT